MTEILDMTSNWRTNFLHFFWGLQPQQPSLRTGLEHLVEKGTTYLCFVDINFDHSHVLIALLKLLST